MWGIYNVFIKGEQKGSIVFDGDKIHRVDTQEINWQPPKDTDWINGHGCEAYPAGIDMHVHDRWGEPEREDPQHLEAACAEGGVGTIVTMPNTKPAYELAQQTQTRLSGFKIVNVLAWMACTRTNFREREEVRRRFKNLVPGGKLMMASTNNPETLVDDKESQQAILEQNAGLDCITTIHAEAEDYIKESRADYLSRFGSLKRHQHCAIRHSAVEGEGIRRILAIHKNTGGRIHIAHVSTAEGIKRILNAKMLGQDVTFESCPHYWMFDSSKLQMPDAGDFKMNPALRALPEQLEVFGRLCRGDIDVSATDHAPHPHHLKQLKGLDECPSGVPGVEANIPLVHRLKQRGLISAQRFIDLTSRRPAQILGLNKGELKAGFDADVILIDPKRTKVFSDENTKSKCGWTPYRGEKVNVVAAIVINGKMIKQNL